MTARKKNPPAYPLTIRPQRTAVLSDGADLTLLPWLLVFLIGFLLVLSRHKILGFARHNTLLYKLRRTQLLVYRDQKKLMEEGEVVVAILVEANGALFKKGFGDGPANVIYAGERSVENLLPKLSELATRIFSLKGTKPEDPDEKKFAGMVSYEYGRDFPVPVRGRLGRFGGDHPKIWGPKKFA